MRKLSTRVKERKKEGIYLLKVSVDSSLTSKKSVIVKYKGLVYIFIVPLYYYFCQMKMLFFLYQTVAVRLVNAFFSVIIRVYILLYYNTLYETIYRGN